MGVEEISSSRFKELLLDRKKLRLLIAFHEQSRRTEGLNGALRVLAKEIKELIGADRVTLFLLDVTKQELYARMAAGINDELLPTLRLPIKQGIAGAAFRSAKTINVIEASKDLRFDPRFDELYGFKTKSVIATPLVNSHGETMGVLEVFNKKGGEKFNKQDEGLLKLIAGQLAAMLENDQLLEQLKRSNLEAIYILAQAAEYRDQEDTAMHLKRIGDYVTILAKTLGLPDPDVENLRFASPLHDIGKIAIPDAILRKPGRFTPEEYDEMKKHTIFGYEILKDAESPMLQLARDIALTHHERYDGTGYPKKIKGKDIPLASRIVSLADVFDALSTERIYKPPWPLEKVVEYVESQSGKHFDPEIVEAFKIALPKIEPFMRP